MTYGNIQSRVLSTIISVTALLFACAKPLAAAVKVAVPPDATVTFAGCTVMAGGVPTGRHAALLVAVPTELVNTARSFHPLTKPVTVLLKVVDVAPARFAQVVPPLVEYCHWTVGVG